MYISSDSNIWFDFCSTNALEYPFRLGYDFYISRVTFDEEIVEPVSLREALLEYGLHLTDFQDNELQTAYLFIKTYIHLSVHDSFALVIAKHRGWVLLTGNKSLIKAANRENVECHGTVWIYDQLALLGKNHKRRKEQSDGCAY